MAFDDLVRDIDSLKTTRPRYFRQWLDLADPEEKRVVLDAIGDERIPANQLARLLAERYNVPITRETILRMRLGGR